MHTFLELLTYFRNIYYMQHTYPCSIFPCSILYLVLEPFFSSNAQFAIPRWRIRCAHEWDATANIQMEMEMKLHDNWNTHSVTGETKGKFLNHLHFFALRVYLTLFLSVSVFNCYPTFFLVFFFPFVVVFRSKASRRLFFFLN